MLSRNPGWFRHQARFLTHQFLQEGSLPFTGVLSDQLVMECLANLNVCWLDRIYTPLVTLWVFLGQVLCADHSCRAAVARLIAHRISQEQPPCSSETGAYCLARKRLPETFFSHIARATGRALDSAAKAEWRWLGRRVLIYDGSTVSMPDTPENQAAYPQATAQKPGLGFPLARIAALFSLSCGVVVDFAICRYAGKGQSELGMLRTLLDAFLPGDVMLGDRLMCSWTEMVMLKERGIDCICRFTSHRRTADFRRGQRLGKGDHIVKWRKPPKPGSIDRKAYNALPEYLMVREILVHVNQPGFRCHSLLIATTLLDHEAYTRDDLGQLYRARWHAELDLRSLKQTLQMDILRCKTPELVRKELWTHILAYNLIRTIIAQAADKHVVNPRSISFKGAVQTLEAFQPLIAAYEELTTSIRQHLYAQILEAIVKHRVADRPNRFEPRRKKRRPKPYDRLMKPRAEAKREMLKGFRDN